MASGEKKAIRDDTDQRCPRYCSPERCRARFRQSSVTTSAARRCLKREWVSAGRRHQLEPVLCYPSSHLFRHRKMLSVIVFIAAAEPIGIHFQRYRLVAASIDKSKYVELGKTRNAKLAILFHVNKFVKKQTIGEMKMAHDFV